MLRAYHGVGHHHQIGHLTEHGNAGEVARGMPRAASREKAGSVTCRERGQQQGVSIGLGAGHRLGADAAAGARPRLDHHRLPERGGEPSR
jgi:hypothetical protein